MIIDALSVPNGDGAQPGRLRPSEGKSFWTGLTRWRQWGIAQAGKSSEAGSLGMGSERQDGVGDLLAVARLLYVGDLAAAAVGDARLSDLFGRDGVV